MSIDQVSGVTGVKAPEKQDSAKPVKTEKEVQVNGFASSDNPLNKVKSSVSTNPFVAGVNEKQPEASDVKGMVAKRFFVISDKIDENHDGFITKRELGNKMSDPSIKGQDAALVGALAQHRWRIGALSNSEDKTLGLRGITKQDLVAYDKLPSGDKLKDEVDSTFYTIQGNSSWTNNKIKDKDGNIILPKTASDVDYKDLQQGQAGDCYFLAALASFAQRHPQKVVDMIKDNKNGTYDVKFADRTVTIKAPSDAELGLYGSGKGWMPIIEKGYAKYRDEKNILDFSNDYDLIGGGSTIVGRGIKELTGNSFDTDIIKIVPDDKMRQKLKNATDNNKLMTASINKHLFGKDSLGLPDGHVYTVLGFDSKTDKVQIRNPWGQTEAKGPNGGPRDGKDDGIFELSLAEFKQHFTQIAFEK